MTFIQIWLTSLSVVIISAAFFIYSWINHKSKYWDKNNVSNVPGTPILGNLSEFFTFKKCITDVLTDLYNKSKSPILGIHIFHKPALIINEPELIKQILIKDFNYFSNRHTCSDPKSDALGGYNLFLVRNPIWKEMRTKLTPVFTSGKIKQMFQLISVIGKEMDSHIRRIPMEQSKNGTCVEIKEICSKYTTDVIASTAFGLKSNCLSDPDDDFRKNGKRLFDFSIKRAIEFASFFFLPEVVSLFKFKLFSAPTSVFLRSTINYVMGEREKSGEIRNDLIDVLVKLKNEDKNKKVSDDHLTFHGDILVAQAAVFFSAGFETTSATMAFGLYELAMQSHLQTRLKDEIKESLLKNNGDITYESVNEMEYLNMVVLEVLRMYPPLPFLDRICEPPVDGEMGYSLKPFSNFVIPKKMPVLIPVYSIQRDANHFPDPDKFDPERFSSQNKHNIKPYTYMPFGLGPHNCIGIIYFVF